MAAPKYSRSSHVTSQLLIIAGRRMLITNSGTLCSARLQNVVILCLFGRVYACETLLRPEPAGNLDRA